jgi:Cu-processing system ATP-binding protein
VREIVSVKGLSKEFGDVTALSDVSFSVNPGEAVLLLGPNGAGKTTIIKCILGLLNFHGEIVVGGFNVKTEGNLARAMIGYLPQLSSYYETLTVIQHARLMASLKGADQGEILKSLDFVGLLDVQNRMVKALSSGMRQRLGLSIALLGNPHILILDEPTSNIDLEGRLEFRRMLQNLKTAGKALLISTHISGLDAIADRVVVLNGGKIVTEGRSDQILEMLGVNDRVYLKVEIDQIPIVNKVADSFGVVPQFKDGWLSVLMAPKDKAAFIDTLIGKGARIKDLVIEQFSIESEYVRLIKAKDNHA